ncbi:DUF6443 domain-containing protein [uncultured Bacteroides sp.]|uniref:DUF6443 domain-containing protein n=1 Tax=uncultured Bacteroides sp. TaxID=162156 RepID=UPI002AAAD5B2|nr:DUF6443 domain-containing protein [uncultured Bacteroides sp.]
MIKFKYVVAFVLLLFSGIVHASPKIYISEVFYDTPENEDDNITPSHNGEYVQLYNDEDFSLNLSGWKISIPDRREEFTFPMNTVLPSKAVVVICYQCDSLFEFTKIFPKYVVDNNHLLCYHKKFVLSNTQSAILLKDNSGYVIDQMEYGKNGLSASNGANITTDYCMSLRRQSVNIDLGKTFFAISDYTRSPVNPMRMPTLIYKSVSSSNDSDLAIDIPQEINSQNYVLALQLTKKLSSVENVLDPSNTLYLAQYYDGLGRPVETVQRGVTPNRKDIVVMQEYDSIGRESNKWLPTPYAGNGNFVDPNILIEESRRVYQDSNPFTHTVYEASPLNRAVEEYGAGASWQNTNHSTRNKFLANNDFDKMLKCSFFLITQNGQLEKRGIYNNGELYVTENIDEDNHESYTFKDKLDKVVLIRQINNGELYDTYYVHDDSGNLRFVLPPMAVDLLTVNKVYSDTEDALQKYGYIYKYDDYNRCISKKLPGAEAITMVYDSADHLLFTQDGEQRKYGEWTFNIPDVFNRPTVSGICTNINSDVFKNLVINSTYIGNAEGLLDTGYQLNNVTINISRILTVNYYDNYAFLDLSKVSPYKTKLTCQSMNGYASQYVNEIYPEISAKSLLTGTRIFMLGADSQEAISVTYYDDRGRVAQTKSTNHLGGFDNNYFAYTFTGKPIKYFHEHTANGKPSIKELTAYTYDHAERLLKTTHSLNGSTPVILAENTYDDMGRLQSKKQHGGVEITNYAYNLRSWLKGITTTNNRFSETLYYNESSNGSIPCYNGNISAMNWKVQNDTQRGYNFHYDDLSRITAADYQNNDANTGKNYSTTYVYDNMGNMKNLRRYGLSAKPSIFGIIDDLALSYNGNQLSSVTDASTGEPLYSGAFNFVKDTLKTTEYTYDANGNLTRDSHKKIAKIQYNILNLPSALQFTEGHTSEYLYDAAGVKRRVKQVTTTENLLVPMGSMLPVPADKVAVTTQTDYCGNVIYENGILNKILVDEGYITMNGTTPTYHYYIQDHQGNNRVVFNQSGTVEQTNHYYPFGMTFGEGIDNSDNRYKYNDKELDGMHGLDLYDYGARHYDAAIGRWGVMDPLTEKHYNISSYVYCLNNPITYIDPLGLDTIPSNALPQNWSDFDPKNDIVMLNGVEVTAHTEEATNNFMYPMLINNKVVKGKKIVDYSSMMGSIYAGYRYTERPLGEGYFRTAKGNLHSLSELKPQANGKYVRGVQGLRIGAKSAKYSVRLLSRSLNLVSYISTGYSGYRFYNNPNWSDGFDVTVGIASYAWWEVGVASSLVSAAQSEIEQRNENIVNNKDPMEGVYNPALGM